MVSVLTAYGLLLLVSNVWWSLLSLTNLTNSSSFQNGTTEMEVSLNCVT